MSKGQQAYMGKAKDSSKYFAAIGHPINEMINPAEFLLDLVNADFNSDASVDSILEEWKKVKANETNVKQEIPSVDPADDSFRVLINRQKSRVHELSTLFRRHTLIIGRDPFLYVGRSITIQVASIVFALAYWNSRERDQEQVVNFFYANLWFQSIGSLLAVVAVYVLNGEFKSVHREVKNGLLHPLIYIAAKSVLVLPVMIVFGIAGITVSGYAILNAKGGYGIYLAMYAISMFVWECFAEMFSVMDIDPLLGMLKFLAVWFSAFLFAGIFLPSKDIPIVVRWLYYILPFSNSFSAISYHTIISEDWESCDPFQEDIDRGPICVDFDLYPEEAKSGAIVLDAFHKLVPLISSEDKRPRQMGTLMGMALVAKSIYIAIVLFKSSRATRLHQHLEETETTEEI